MEQSISIPTNNSGLNTKIFHEGGIWEEYVVVAKMTMESQKPYQLLIFYV